MEWNLERTNWQIGAKDEMLLETEKETGMFSPTVSILLEFHKRVQKKNFTRNAGGIGRQPMVLARILLFSLTIPNWDTTIKSPKKIDDTEKIWIRLAEPFLIIVMLHQNFPRPFSFFLMPF